jgi:hypothetical protein
METYVNQDSLEILSEELRRQISKEKDGVQSATLLASLESAEWAIMNLPVQKKLKLQNITVVKFYGGGTMGTVWLVSFRNQQ